MKDEKQEVLEKDIFEDDISEKEYKKLKIRFEDLQKRKKGKFSLFIGLVTSALFSVAFLLLIFDTYNYQNTIMGVIFSVGIGGLIGIGMAIYTSMVYEMQESKIRRRMLEYEAENIQDDVEEDIFENSIKMSYKYLDQYYLQTREQAQRGFFVTVCVAVFGAVLLGIGIVAMFFEKTNPSYITCASGVITEFIAAIFFYLYNRTVSSMSKYHNKLVISQNISIALKVADTLPTDDKTKAKNTIISELLRDVNSYLITSDAENKG